MLLAIRDRNGALILTANSRGLETMRNLRAVPAMTAEVDRDYCENLQPGSCRLKGAI